MKTMRNLLDTYLAYIIKVGSKWPLNVMMAGINMEAKMAKPSTVGPTRLHRHKQ